MNKICNTYLFKMDGDWDERDCTVVDFYQFLSGNKKNFESKIFFQIIFLSKKSFKSQDIVIKLSV